MSRNIYDNIKAAWSKKIIEHDIKPILMDTADCFLFRLDTEDMTKPKRCTGCGGELQCSKLMTIMMIVYATSFTNDADPELVKSFIDRIIESKEVSDVKTLASKFLKEV